MSTHSVISEARNAKIVRIEHRDQSSSQIRSFHTITDANSLSSGDTKLNRGNVLARLAVAIDICVTRHTRTFAREHALAISRLGLNMRL